MTRVYLANEPLTRNDCHVGIQKLFGAINRNEGEKTVGGGRGWNEDLAMGSDFSGRFRDASGIKVGEFRAKCRLLSASSVRAPVECDEGIHSAVQRSSPIHREPRWMLEPALLPLIVRPLRKSREFLCGKIYKRSMHDEVLTLEIDSRETKQSNVWITKLFENIGTGLEA